MKWNTIIGAVTLAVALAGCGVGTEEEPSSGAPQRPADDQSTTGSALNAPVPLCSLHTTEATCVQQTGCQWLRVAAPCYVLPGQPPQCPGTGGSCVSSVSTPPPSDGGVQVGPPTHT